MPTQLIHRIFICIVQRQVAVLGIPHQQSLALQVARQALSDGVGELCELSAARCFYPTKPGRWTGFAYIHTIKKQHVEMDIQVQRTAKTLNQRDCSSVGR